MTLEEIRAELVDNNAKQRQSRLEHNNLVKRHAELRQGMQDLLFEKVLSCISVGDVITFSSGYSGGIRNGDRVKVIRKNKKSVTVEYLHREYTWVREKIGDHKRILAKVFGKLVYYNSNKSDLIQRDSRLAELLS